MAFNHYSKLTNGRTMSDLFKIDNFKKQINTLFTFQAEGSEAISVELVEVAGRGQTIPGKGKENFSLLFNDKENPAIGQCVVKINHGELGQFEAFVVPVIPDRSGVCYEVVFSFMPD